MDIDSLMQQAQQMQTKMQELQDNLEQSEVEGVAGGGLVKARMNGKGIATRILIDPAIINPAEKEVLEDLVLAALQDAKTKVEDTFNDQLSGLAASLGLPADFKFPM